MQLLPHIARLFLLTAAAASAADGISPAWTQVAAADQSLMGDYQGEWINAENGYFQINKPLAAQVLNVRPGEYFLRLFQQHDCRADPYFEGPAKLDGEVIRFDTNGWTGTISKDGLSGTSGQGSHTAGVRFELKKVVLASPTSGAKPPEGAIVLFDGKNFDQWQQRGNRPVTWHLLGNGAMEVRSPQNPEERQSGIGGDIQTKRNFGDCRVHLEFRYPVEAGKSGQNRGNSGLFFQGEYEVQILNSYALQGWWNECGA
ncbi:MAG: hypothetical protein RLZZ214_384, partial [Verrucomicrobiota bacterium]